mgnify:CR=1 FL=1
MILINDYAIVSGVVPLSGVSGVSRVSGSVGSSFLFSLRVARDLKLAFW